MIKRRGLVTGLLAAPAIIRTPGLLMLIKPARPFELFYEVSVASMIPSRLLLQHVRLGPDESVSALSQHFAYIVNQWEEDCVTSDLLDCLIATYVRPGGRSSGTSGRRIRSAGDVGTAPATGR